MKNLFIAAFLCFSANAFALTLTGHTATPVNTATDSIYAAVYWGHDDSPTIISNATKITNSTFTMEVATPPDAGILKEDGIAFSVAYIVLFKDKNGNGAYDKGVDKLAGLSETHCVTYLQGNLNAFLDKAQAKKGTEIKNMRTLKEGLNLAKVVRPGKDEHFDDLQHTAEAEDVEVKVGNPKDLDVPNWT